MPKLVVRIISARNFPEGDYCCKVKCGKSDKSSSTKVIKKTTAPEWDESFTLSIEENSDIQIEVVQSKKIRSNKFGTINISSLNHLRQGKEKILWVKEGLQGDAEVQVGLTAIDFGKVGKNKKSNEEAPISLSSLPVFRKSDTSETPHPHSLAISSPTVSSSSPSMPSPEEVEKQYNQLMESLGLDDKSGFKHPTDIQTKAMAKISLENKWAMICQHKKMESTKSKGTLEDTPGFWTQKLKAEPSANLLRDLRILLGGESIGWLQDFIKYDGLSCLFQILGNVELHLGQRKSVGGQDLQKEEENVQMQVECVKCLYTLMNNRVDIGKSLF